MAALTVLKTKCQILSRRPEHYLRGQRIASATPFKESGDLGPRMTLNPKSEVARFWVKINSCEHRKTSAGRSGDDEADAIAEAVLR